MGEIDDCYVGTRSFSSVCSIERNVLRKSSGVKWICEKLVLAGPHKDDYIKMMVLIDFESPEAMKVFAGHKELKTKCLDAEAILKSNLITVIGDFPSLNKTSKHSNKIIRVE